MLLQVDVLAPVTAVGQLAMGTATVHPLITFGGVVVVGERKVRRAVGQRFTHGHALGIKLVGHATNRRLGAFVVNVPGLEMLQRPRVHHDQRRVDDRACVHQRTAQGVFNRLDARVGFTQHRKSMLGQVAGEYTGRQAGGVAADHQVAGAMLAYQVRQRTGFSEGDLAPVARIGHGLGKHETAKGARRQEHHLTVVQVRRNMFGQVFVGGRRQWNDHQLRVAQGFGQVVG
ncbi:hypothetical protein D3C84_632220 [compost metagenome]